MPQGVIPEEHQETHLQGRIGADSRFETLLGLSLIPDGVPRRHIGSTWSRSTIDPWSFDLTEP